MKKNKHKKVIGNTTVILEDNRELDSEIEEFLRRIITITEQYYPDGVFMIFENNDLTKDRIYSYTIILRDPEREKNDQR